MIDCPDCCSGHTKVIESRRCSEGTRRRRHQCLSCNHRWTSWDGPRPSPGFTGKNRSTAKRGRSLTPDDVRQILLSPRALPNSELGRRFDVSYELVRQVRLGRVHATVHPELPRWPDPRRGQPGRTCHNCANWSAGGCSFGFPEPLEDGPAFALECDLYEA